MQHNMVLLNLRFAFTPSCSLEAGLMLSQHQRTKIHNFHRHTPHVDLGGRGGDDPFHKGAVSRADSITVLNFLSSNNISPSFCYTRIRARTRTHSNMRLCFQILFNSFFTLYFPEWPRISCLPPDRIDQSFSSPPNQFLYKEGSVMSFEIFV